jgi:hypothetical protein
MYLKETANERELARKTVEGGPDYLAASKPPTVAERFEKLVNIFYDHTKIDDSEIINGLLLSKYFEIVEYSAGSVIYDIGDVPDKVMLYILQNPVVYS